MKNLLKGVVDTKEVKYLKYKEDMQATYLDLYNKLTAK